MALDGIFTSDTQAICVTGVFTSFTALMAYLATDAHHNQSQHLKPYIAACTAGAVMTGLAFRSAYQYFEEPSD